MGGAVPGSCNVKLKRTNTKSLAKEFSKILISYMFNSILSNHCSSSLHVAAHNFQIKINNFILGLSAYRHRFATATAELHALIKPYPCVQASYKIQVHARRAARIILNYVTGYGWASTVSWSWNVKAEPCALHCCTLMMYWYIDNWKRTNVNLKFWTAWPLKLHCHRSSEELPALLGQLTPKCCYISACKARESQASPGNWDPNKIKT